jgi:NAD(P)-dependent dehydrogenase (short-subunit alcohol dehydrogenase family)
LVITPMVEAELTWRRERLGQSPEDALAQWVARIPLGRVQTADDVANTVLFLASSEASAMTGQAINVTGGMITE